MKESLAPDRDVTVSLTAPEAGPNAANDTLFGRLALLNGFVSQEALDQAMRQQKAAPSSSFAAILVENGSLSSEDRQAIELLLERHLAKHNNDPQESLSTLTLLPNKPLADTVLITLTANDSQHPQKSFGHYELLSEIARGGMGVVYKARQTKLNRLVALKMIRAGELADPEQVKRFYTEAEAAAKLDHPGIVPVYEVGEINGQHFFSMAFIQGQSLNDRVKADGPLPPKLAAKLIQTVANAVQFAHDKGIVHRDIKPHNILLDEIEQPRVADFGLAKQVQGASEMTTTGQVLGTPSYMPPEQAAGKTDEVGKSADVYSLGATLYCLLTGRPPFQASSLAETIRQVLDDQPVPLRRLNPEIPRDLETICLKCLRKEPERRYSSARELADDLGRWLDNKPITARPVGPAERTWLWCRRRPALVGLSLTFLTLAVIGTLVGTSISAKQQNLTRVEGLVDTLMNAATPQVPEIVRQLEDSRKWADPLLEKKLSQAADGSIQKLHLSLALAGKDERQVEFLYQQLLTADPAKLPIIRDALLGHKDRVQDRLWAVLTSRESDPRQQRLRAAAALAKYDPANPLWDECSPEVAEQLVSVNPVFLGPWQEAMRSVANHLVPSLAKILNDPQQGELPRTLATSLLADYAKADSETLTNLVVSADAKTFAILFPVLQAHGSVAVEKLRAVLARKLEPSWGDAPLNPSWQTPSVDSRAAIEEAHGMLAERFAFCQDMPWKEFVRVSESLRACGYRPTRVRPHGNTLAVEPDAASGTDSDTRVAAIWARDNRNWKLETDLTKSQFPPADVPATRDGMLPADFAVWPAADAAAERRFLLLWSESIAAGEQRHFLADLSEQSIITAQARLSKQGFGSQIAMGVWVDSRGQRRYAGIWSNQGAPSELIPDYSGFEMLDQPQRDVAVASSQYAAVWHADVEMESRLEIGSLDPGQQSVEGKDKEAVSSRSRELASQGFRPVAIAVSPSSATQIVWHRPLISDTAKEQLAQQQATAGAALLKFEGSLAESENNPETVAELSSLFNHTPDPRLRSYVLHRLVPLGVNPAAVLNRLSAESEVSRRRALILGLGEFARAKMLSDQQQRTLVGDLAKLYVDDPDPGIHSAAEWSLRQLGADEEIAKVRTVHSTGKVVGSRRWYLTKTGVDSSSGLTLVVVKPEEFLMGSPVAEAEREQGPTGKNEIRHRRRMGRTFAIGAHEVTVMQFEAFRGSHQFDRTKAREVDAPANNVSWYDAAAFCNWLSEQEGIPRSQWSYDPDQEFTEGMTLYPDYLQRTGYRLPTESESEYACRSGAVTARFFGETETLLGEYAWYAKNSGDKWMLPVGSLKPNDFGLFDSQGNALEWCQDAAMLYGHPRPWLEDSEQIARWRKLSNPQARILRGGSFFHIAANVRSAYRANFQPNFRNSVIGFRVARTYP